MDLLANGTLEKGRGTCPQHLLQTITRKILFGWSLLQSIDKTPVETMATEFELPASSPIPVHFSQADGTVLKRFHRLPTNCVLIQGVQGLQGVGVCNRLRLCCCWWIICKHGATDREIVLKEIVQKRVVSSSQEASTWLLDKGDLLGLSNLLRKLLGSWS